MNITKRNLAFNGLGQFFIHTYYSDGSVDSMGPFATGEEAVAELDILVRMDAEEEEAEALQWETESKQILWAEMGGYASGLARPCPRRSVADTSRWVDEDIPF